MIAKDTAKRNKHYHNLEYEHSQEGEIYLVACGMERCDPAVTYGPELRDCYHLHAVLSGTGVLKVNGLTFHPHFGQLFLLKDNEVVEYSADEKDPWEYCWVTFNGTRAVEFIEKIGFTKDVYCVDSDLDTHEFYQLVLRMHEKPEMNQINDLRRKGILLEYLAMAMEATQKKGKKSPRTYEYEPEIYVKRALEFIAYNYQMITVADVIKFVGFSRSYFATLFKQKVGVSLQKYLIQYRIRKACELLEQTDQPIQLIAEKVGYENQLAFSRCFRKEMGISPTQYRENQEG